MPEKLARLAILVSETGRDPWVPLPPENVPEWLKDPDIIGQLVAGQMCMDPTIGEAGSPWYRAVELPTEH